MAFIIFDLIFLLFFCLAVGLFLYKKRKKLKIESKVFLLYKTKTGINFINKFSKKFSSLLGIISYFSIAFGFIATIMAIFLLYKTAEMLFKAVAVPKVPPIMPLVPYLPEIFRLPLPPFYFTYWLLIIAVIAITHEFSHGIFASFYKLKIKATGFGFFGPFLLAFVEPDEKAMKKKKPKQQLAILSAGSFANFLCAIIFFFFLQLFFVLSTYPSNIIYAGTIINTSEIRNFSLDSTIIEREEILSVLGDSYKLVKIYTTNSSYYLTEKLLKEQLGKNVSSIFVFYDSPLIRANLSGEIVKINNIPARHYDKIFKNLSQIKPHELVVIETTKGKYEIIAEEHPTNKSRGFVGLGSAFVPVRGLAKIIQDLSSPARNPFMFYDSKYDTETFMFFFNFLWWMVIICISVALINMLPFGMLDGGRFVYVAVLGLTKSKKVAENIYKIVAFFVLLILFALGIAWLMKAF